MKKIKFLIFREKTVKKFFTGDVFHFILIPILPTYGFFRRLRIAFQTCTRIFLVITWQPWVIVHGEVFVQAFTHTRRPFILNEINELHEILHANKRERMM